MKEQPVTIHAAGVNDYPTCLPLFNVLYHGDVGPNFKSTFEEYVTREDGIILLAEQRHKLIGILMGSFQLDIDWEGTTAKIDAIIVDQDYRMKGIGRELAQHFIAKARQKNCKAVKARVNRKNTIAQKFHKNLGFSEANTYEYVMDL